MERYPVIKAIVDSYDNSTELEEIVTMTGFEDDPYVRQRLIELKWRELELELDMPTPDTSTLYDVTELCSTSNDAEPVTNRQRLDQYGGQSSPQPGPSNIDQHDPPQQPYRLVKIGENKFKTKAAVDTKYRVQLDQEFWQDKKLKDILVDLHDMFQNVLDEAKDGAEPNDSGRVLINHSSLDNVIVVPLRPLEELDAKVVLEHIEKVLTSHEEWDITDGFTIDVGIINVPKGAVRMKLTNIHVENNSIKKKKSLVQIVNEDEICMARSSKIISPFPTKLGL